MSRLDAHGFTVEVPEGWEARIYRRPAAGEVAATAGDGAPAPPGETTHAVVHVASVPMPPDLGDFGSAGVDRLGPTDAFIVVFDYGPHAVGAPLFARAGMPRALEPGDFAPNVLQRSLPGQSGYQAFFTENGRACCLYVVLGSHANRRQTVPRVNTVLAGLQIGVEVQLVAPVPPATVLAVLTDDPTLSGFARLVARAGLAGELRHPGPLTVFVPTDGALARVAHLPEIERDAPRLERVVRFHVVPGVVDVGQLVATRSSASATTLAGRSLRVDGSGPRPEVEGVAIDPARIIAGNGSVYTIAGLLEPPP